MNARFAVLHRLLAVSAVAIVAFSFAGCTTLSGTGGLLSGMVGSPPTAEAQPPVPPAATYTVELRPAKGKPEVKQLPLNGSTLVQQGLEQSGALKRFHRMNTFLMRSSGDERHKMEVKFDRKTGNVNPLYDYTLAPGDHLVVTEDPSNSLDDMLNSLGSQLGPLGLPSKK